MLSSIQLQLLAVPGWTAVLIAIVTLLIGAGGTFVILKYLNFKNKEKIANANLEATKILEDARVEAKSIRKEASLEARDERQKLKNEFDKEVSESKKELEKEIKERRGELAKIEQRILQKEEASDKRESNLEKKQDLIETQKKDLESKELEIKNMEAEVKNSHDKMIKELERVAGLTRDEAKQSLINELIEDAKRDAGTLAKQIEQTAKDEAEKKAKNIVSLAIQKCATDHSSEITVSSVALPNEEMKGRIIGRVGRNIRALESATGVDLIIDDTPDVVTLSSFDPVRREVARITLEKLISDGRIHPARIEEMVEKVRREIDSLIKEAGDAAVFEAGLYNVHPEIIKLIGRLKYRTSYGQNVLKHSLEVSHLAGLMAAELGADVKIAKRGGLLHDLGKAVDQEVEGTHVSIGVDLAKKYKENKDVILCIAAHHGDTDPTTIEAILVQAADGISGGRPGARRESIENYIKRLEKLENVANSFKGVESSFAIQAGREIRVMVKPEVVDDASTIFMAKEIAQKLESELDYPGQIKVNVIRELRSIEYAK